jgi:hypothetical protein
MCKYSVINDRRSLLMRMFLQRRLKAFCIPLPYCLGSTKDETGHKNENNRYESGIFSRLTKSQRNYRVQYKNNCTQRTEFCVL